MAQLNKSFNSNSLKRIADKGNIDEIRQKNIAYEYLCHLEEAKIWIESCINETLPASTILEESLRNGVALAKLGHYLNPDIVPLNRIYDIELERYNKVGLQFKHTDNINYFLKSVGATQLPRTFLPETVDIYEKKNMPRLIYCIHALSVHLFRVGQAPLIQDLYGKVQFSDDEIVKMSAQLEEYNVPLPSFQKLNQIMSPKGTKLDKLKNINDAIRTKDISALKSLLKPPVYRLIDQLLPQYIDVLHIALCEKIEQLENLSFNESFERTEFSELLTQNDIQGYVTRVNVEYTWDMLICNYKSDTPVGDTLKCNHVNVQNIVPDYEPFYKSELSSYILSEQSKTGFPSTTATTLKPNEKLIILQKLVYRGNEKALNEKHRADLIKQINTLMNKAISQSSNKTTSQSIIGSTTTIGNDDDEESLNGPTPSKWRKTSDSKKECLNFEPSNTSASSLASLTATPKASPMKNVSFSKNGIATPTVQHQKSTIGSPMKTAFVQESPSTPMSVLSPSSKFSALKNTFSKNATAVVGRSPKGTNITNDEPTGFVRNGSYVKNMVQMKNTPPKNFAQIRNTFEDLSHQNTPATGSRFRGNSTMFSDVQNTPMPRNFSSLNQQNARGETEQVGNTEETMTNKTALCFSPPKNFSRIGSSTENDVNGMMMESSSPSSGTKLSTLKDITNLSPWNGVGDGGHEFAAAGATFSPLSLIASRQSSRSALNQHKGSPMRRAADQQLKLMNELFNLLSNVSLGLTESVNKYSLRLYFDELAHVKRAGEITYENLKQTITVQNYIGNISQSLTTSTKFFWDALNCPQLNWSSDLRKDLQTDYLMALTACLSLKQRTMSTIGGPAVLLNWADIRKCVDMVNEEHQLQNKSIQCLKQINELLSEMCKWRPDVEKVNELKSLLMDPCLDIRDVSDVRDDELLVTLLSEKFKEKNEQDEDSYIWLEEIQDVVQQCLLIVQNIDVFMMENAPHKKMEEEARSMEPVWEVYNISSRDVYIDLNNGKYSWRKPDRFNEYSSTTTTAHQKPSTAGTTGRKSLDKSDVYKNLNEVFIIKLQARCRGLLERRKFVDAYLEKNDREEKKEDGDGEEEFSLSSSILSGRGDESEAQEWWKDVEAMKRNAAGGARIEEVEGEDVAPGDDNEVEMRSVDEEMETSDGENGEDSFEKRMAYYEKNVEKIIKIQAVWRGKMLRNVILFSKPSSSSVAHNHQKPPSYHLLKQFVRLLDDNISDYRTAIELQHIRSEISKLISQNKQLNSILDDLDLKICLLVQNRLSLTDVIQNSGACFQYATGSVLQVHSSLKNNTFEKYEYLFYMLQTRPRYLTNLIWVMPSTQTKKFLEGIILTLYNYGQSSRDEYLLLKFLSLLLEREVNNSDKYVKPLDIITTPPLVLKVIIQYARMKVGTVSLRTILKPLIEKILKEESIIAYTNPITIYNKWRNQLELSTGKVSELPKNVETVEEALQYEHVARTLATGIQKLENTTGVFLKRIVASKDYIPFGLLYIISRLNEIMHQRFCSGSTPHSRELVPLKSTTSLYPDLSNFKEIEASKPDEAVTYPGKGEEPEGALVKATQAREAGPTATTTENSAEPEKDIVKVIGHFLYYNFLNSAIVAPESYKIVTLKPNQELTMEQRHNLATVAKLLQFSAAKKGYGEDTPHLKCLNKFITYCHDKLRTFFIQCCHVPSLEDHYHINEYSEELLQSPPTIYISVQEVLTLHRLLRTYDFEVCPNRNDPLATLLHQMGEPNQLYALIGVDESDVSLALNNSELSLTLSNKYEVEHGRSSDQTLDEDINMAKVFIEAKELLVCVLPCLSGPRLPGALRMDATKEQELAFKERINHIVKYTNNASLMQYAHMSLRECKTKLRRYLSILEKNGFLSKENGYQEIITKLVQDIYYKNTYRKLQSKELQTVRETRQCFLERIEACKEKIDFYEKYLRTCLQNQTLGKRNVHVALSGNDKQQRKLMTKLTIKYTGKQLYDKGILLEVEGLNQNQLKNILLEFKPCEAYGAFKINGKFMGVQMDSVEINIQDLLQKQFLGISIMDIFGKAKVNVNLLLHLLNKKYYSKH